MSFSSYNAALHAITRARRLLDGAHTVRPRYRRADSGRRVRVPRTLRSEVVADMRRLSVVMAVAALDTYMHRLIVERAFWHDDLPGGLAGLEVEFATLLRQAEETDEAARAEPYRPRSKVRVKRQLRDRLLRETYQNADAVSRALGMAGKSGSWPEIAAHLSPAREPAEVKHHLNEIVMRRNQIVHEGDYQRLDKPRGPKRNWITQAAARRDIDFIEQLINAIHSVVSS